jgi:hypothetical protein
MNLEQLEPGKSYACRFRTVTFLDSEGEPVQANLSIGAAHPGTPGTYSSVGIIRTRDLAQCRVELIDTQSHRTFVVSTDSIWDIDSVEWVDNS